MGSDSSSMWDRPLTPPEQAIGELPVVAVPPPVPKPTSLFGWLNRLVPRFSLLTLLLLMTLIALGAAFVAMKSSLERQLREQQQAHHKQREAERQAQEIRNNLAQADQNIIMHVMNAPNLAAEGWLQVRHSSDANGLYNILLVLEPKKNYALHWQHLGREGRTIQKQSAVIRRIDSPHPSRQVLALYFTRGNAPTAADLESPQVFEASISCRPVLYTFVQQASGGHLMSRPLTPQITLPKIKVMQELGTTNLRQCFTKEHSFLKEKEIKLFEVTGWCQELLEDQSLELKLVLHSLDISLEQLSDAELPLLAQPLEFGK